MSTKPILRLAVVALAFIVVNPGGSLLLAQGSLTPPAGAPGPVMKSLDQIEARRPISTIPFTISQPGSYYLTRNLTTSVAGGITIAANGVTLDLNGFTISSSAANSAAGGFAILLNATDIAIYNGHIRGGVTNNGNGTYSGPGFAFGIAYASTPEAASVRVRDVSVSGCLNGGILLGEGNATSVESSIVRAVGGTGISAAVVKNCVAEDCRAFAIKGNSVADSQGVSTGKLGDGAAGIYAETAMNCRGTSTADGSGVHADTAENCRGSSVDGAGIDARGAINCRSSSITHHGLIAFTAQNCNASSESGIGLIAVDTANGCSASSLTKTALSARVAIGCVGYRPVSSSRAIEATIGNSSFASHGTNQITHKYNMP